MLDQLPYKQLVRKEQSHNLLWKTTKIQNYAYHNNNTFEIFLINFDDEDKSLIPSLHKAQPAIIDYEKYIPYFSYKPISVIRETFKQTTQLASPIICFPFKSCFQMFRKKRRNEW